MAFAILLVPCLIAANRAGVWFAERASGTTGAADEDSAKRPPIVATPESLDFGIAWETEDFHWNIVFQNTSNAPAVLGEVRGACSCTTVGRTSEVQLNPGEKTTVPLVVNLLHLRKLDPSEVRGVEIEILTPIGSTADSKPMRRWLLRGGVRRLLNYDPPLFNLGEELISGEKGRRLECLLTANGPIRQLGLKRVPAGWQAELLKQGQTTPPSYLLCATPCKPNSGSFSDEFELEATTDDGSVQRVQSLVAQGRVTDAVDVLPRRSNLGVVAVGTTPHASVWVRMRNGARMGGLEILPADPRAKVLDVRQEATGWRFDIERPIDAAGSGLFTGVVRVSPSGARSDFVVEWYGADE